jgi:histidinol-phosphate aminotransferase
MELRVIDVPLDRDFDFDLSLLIQGSRAADIAFIASPNSPTGTTLDTRRIEEFLNKADIPVVIDEAYFEFHKESALRLLCEYRNMLIVRTFSKAFGLAGLRLGYLLCSKGLAEQVDKAKPPFSVGIFQQIAGAVVMQNRKSVDAIVAEIIMEREIMYSQLQAIPGITPVPSSANFILFGVDGIQARNVYEALCDNGILVRYFDKPRLSTMLRVTVGKPEENKIFISALKKIMRNKKDKS